MLRHFAIDIQRFPLYELHITLFDSKKKTRFLE